MIAIINNVYQPDKFIKHEFKGALIDFLVAEYPHGFKGKSAIFVNRQLVDVKDYDRQIADNDIVTIFTDVPQAGIDWVYILYMVIIQLAFAAISYALTPRPKNQKKQGSVGRVFEIGSGQNLAALGNVITEHFGTLWFYPDVAAQPYVFYKSNFQFVHEILLIGAGEYRIDDIMLGDTPLGLIPDGLVEWKMYGPNDHKQSLGLITSDFGTDEDMITSVDVQGLDFTKNSVNSFFGKFKSSEPTYIEGTDPPVNFIVGDQVEIYCSGSWYQNNLKICTVTAISNNRLYLSGLVAEPQQPSQQLWFQAVRTVEETGWRGWFIMCPVGKKVYQNDNDFVFPSGLWKMDEEGEMYSNSATFHVEYQRILDDNTDDPINGAFTDIVSISGKGREPQRFTKQKAIPTGRYKIRAKKITRDDITQYEMTACQWTGMKGNVRYVKNQYAYGDVTLLAMKMKGSAALSSVSDKIRVKATRILPLITDDFSNVSRAPTVSVVNAFCQIVREADKDGLELPALKELETRWAGTNGFNHRFNGQTTVYEALQIAAYGHRATPVAYSKLLSMRPDEAKPYDQFIITQEQMLLDSYICGISLGSPVGSIDSYRIEFQDPNSTNSKYVTYPAGGDIAQPPPLPSDPNTNPGIVAGSKPEDVELVGCTDENTALQHAKYLWTKRSLPKRNVEFSTEFESIPFAVGDRISVVNNYVDNVRTARVLAVNGLVLTIDITGDIQGALVKIRDEYGKPSDPINCTLFGNQLALEALPPFMIFGINSGQDMTTVVIGSPTSFARSYSVMSVEPSTSSVKVAATVYSDLPYAFPIPGEVLS